MKKSELFEKQITRILKLLEVERSIVKWNDTVYSDINKEQGRQIDITIKRSEIFIHVECRDHKEPQDVKWIEELIGRKANLKPDMMIAVSNSGFTKNAILTAKEYGIILRDLLTLTDKKIESWGMKTTINIGYLVYDKINIYVLFNNPKIKELSVAEVKNCLLKKQIIDNIFKNIKNSLQNKEIGKGPQDIFIEFIIKENILINNFQVEGIFFYSKISSIHQKVEALTVQVFDNPEVSGNARNVYLEKMNLEGFEIGKHNDEAYCVVDLSSIKNIPKNTQFRGDIVFDMKKPMKMKGSEIYGKELPDLALENIQINIINENKNLFLDNIVKLNPHLKNQ